MPIRWKEQDARSAVRGLYRNLFDRDPEPTALRGVVAYLAEGRLSLRMQFLSMVKSEEFSNKRLTVLPPDQIAVVLYVAVVGREPTNTEKSQAAALIDAAGWKVQIDTLINSEEYIGKFGDDKVPDMPLGPITSAPPS